MAYLIDAQHWQVPFSDETLVEEYDHLEMRIDPETQDKKAKADNEKERDICGGQVSIVREKSGEEDEKLPWTGEKVLQEKDEKNAEEHGKIRI